MERLNQACSYYAIIYINNQCVIDKRCDIRTKTNDIDFSSGNYYTREQALKKIEIMNQSIKEK